MSIWIRNQDKDRLTECNDFPIEELCEYVECDEELVLETNDYSKIEYYKNKEEFKLIRFSSGWFEQEIFRVYKTKNVIVSFKILNQNNVVLGIYSTKEQALKVLDAIQCRIAHAKDNVCEMPQDDEVYINE